MHRLRQRSLVDLEHVTVDACTMYTDKRGLPEAAPQGTCQLRVTCRADGDDHALVHPEDQGDLPQDLQRTAAACDDPSTNARLELRRSCWVPACWFCTKASKDPVAESPS